jgi:hypothetical protein
LLLMLKKSRVPSGVRSIAMPSPPAVGANVVAVPVRCHQLGDAWSWGSADVVEEATGVDVLPVGGDCERFDASVGAWGEVESDSAGRLVDGGEAVDVSPADLGERPTDVQGVAGCGQGADGVVVADTGRPGRQHRSGGCVDSGESAATR